MADCEFDIYQDNLDMRRYISAAAKGVPCVDLPVGCTGELYRERIWSRLSRLSNRTRAFASITRDGDAFGIGLMAWPALKLELHLLLQPVGYCFCGFQIRTDIVCSFPLLRLLLIEYSALVYIIVVSFVASLYLPLFPHTGKSTC